MADDLELEQVETILDAPPVEEKPEPEQKEPHRDEKTGQFASKEAPKTEEKPEPVKAEEKPGETKEDDGAPQVPSWVLKEQKDRAREAEAMAATLEAQLHQLNARVAALDKQPEPKTESVDPLLDPEGFTKKLTTEFSQRLAEVQLNNNLALAHYKHGEKFEKAYSALLAQAQAGNRQLVPALTSQANPGEAIVKWYSDQETLKEVGSDPASYKNKLREEALKDPEFLAKAVEAFKASAGVPRTNNITRAPPSLSRAVGSSSEPDDSELQGVEALLGR